VTSGLQILQGALLRTWEGFIANHHPRTTGAGAMAMAMASPFLPRASHSAARPGISMRAKTS